MTVYRWTPDLALHIIEIDTFKLTYTHIYIYVCIHDRVEEFRLQFNDIIIYPLLGEQLTPIQPMWSAYPYALGFHYMVSICPYFLIWYSYAPTSLYGKSAGREVSGRGRTCGPPLRRLTSLGTSAWPYRVNTQYSYYIASVRHITCFLYSI